MAIDQRLGHHRHRLARKASPAKLVAERLDEHVADGALQIGSRVVHRHGRDLVNGELRAAQDEPHLRAVAVGDDDVPAGFDHVGDMARGHRHLLILVGDRQVIAVADQ